MREQLCKDATKGEKGRRRRLCESRGHFEDPDVAPLLLQPAKAIRKVLAHRLDKVRLPRTSLALEDTDAGAALLEVIERFVE